MVREKDQEEILEDQNCSMVGKTIKEQYLAISMEEGRNREVVVLFRSHNKEGRKIKDPKSMVKMDIVVPEVGPPNHEEKLSNQTALEEAVTGDLGVTTAELYLQVIHRNLRETEDWRSWKLSRIHLILV